MLAAGIELYEMGRAVSAGSERAGRITGKGSGAGTVIGGSATALHAKTFAIDGQRAFVGSFNFDPRSAMLNTELGLVIESPKLSQAIEQAFERTIPASAYEVKLDRNGELSWFEQSGGQTIRHDTEPGTTALQRTAIGFLSLLPIDWLL
jgi:putative cardiolipin synthase